MLPLIQVPAVVFTLQGIAICGTLFLLASLSKWLRRQHRLQRKEVLQLINDCLPQTQCGQCGYAGCLPYAKAIYGGTAINQCPPGGDLTIRRLANLLNRPQRALNPAHGCEGPALVAQIREAECIGCTKCIQVCPTNAIIGARKLMHSVIASDCTGCDLCLEPCPVDCIDMVNAEEATSPQANYRRFNPSAISQL